MTLVYLDDRTTFTVEHDQRYALGDPENPVLVLNALDADGCVWVADEPEGWALPDVSLPMDRRQDGHGGYAGEPSYEPRSLSFAGTVTAPSPEALRRALARLTTAILGEVPNPVRYTHLDDEPARGLWLFPTGQPKWRAWDDRAADFAFVMVAEDPIRTGFADEYGPVRLPSAAGEGGYPLPLVATSTSTGSPTLTETRRNRVPNPAPASASSYSANYGTTGAGALTYVATGGPTGGGFARATWTTASTVAGTGQIRADGRASQPLPIPVTPGEVISAAVYARSSIAQRLLAQVTYFDAAGAQTGISPTGHGGTAQVVGANAWTRLTVEGVTVPAGAAYALVGPQAVTGTGSVVWPIGATLDQALSQIDTAATVGAYFDGDTVDTATANYAWSGTPAASAAVEQTVTPGTGVGNAVLVAQVENVGDEDSHALYTVTGPVPRPRIQLGTGEYVSLDADLGASDVWVVDTAAGTSTVNGVNRYDAWGVGSVFPMIPGGDPVLGIPGGTEVRLRSGLGGTSAAASLVILTAPSWK